MELHEALRQIDAIHAQVARTEVFRGYRAATVAATGLFGWVAAALQPALLPDPQRDLDGYLLLWLGVAAVSIAMVATELSLRWFRTDSPLARQQTLRAVEQFAPCLLAGAAVTWGVVDYLPQASSALPGLWAILFSLGVFASWRQLTPWTLSIAVFYLAAGTACLVLATGEHAFSPWAMAGTFGVGQLLTAAVLSMTLEARHGQA
jgi:hypothetical protein